MELSEFLEARIAEDEAAARGQLELRAQRYPGETDEEGGPAYQVDRGWWLLADPARVLAECIAKRAILEVAKPGGDVAAVAQEMRGEGMPDEVMAIVEVMAQQFEDAVDHSMQVVLKCLALPYKDHPDYQPEWRSS